MKRKRSYTAVDVEHFDLSAVLPLVTVGCIVAIDVAKASRSPISRSSIRSSLA